MIQITLIQIDNYGPWTNNLGDDREHKLQTLQADLYSAAQRNFAERDGLVFFNRFDEMLAVTNGIDVEEHRRIRHAIVEQFPVTVSMGIGVGRTPFEAQSMASRLLQREGGAQSEDRKGAIAFERTIRLSESYAQVMHIDVNEITKMFTNRVSAYETSLGVMSLYVDLMKGFRDHDALVFFIGGDNFMGLTNGITTKEIESLLLRHQSVNGNMSLKCGIGTARSARKAAELATMNLDLIRRTDRSKLVLASAQP
ncbi:MAG: GTP cyclohydrolase IIa [Nitrososphaerota archaeon]|nr:GTP cyclohydrolase IIa [Nitrososphaerota archaeon]